jgi:hypothetical protein
MRRSDHPVAKKKSARRPNLPAETLERARAELRGETPSPAKLDEAPGVTDGTSAAAAAARLKQARVGTGLATRRIPTDAELRTEYAYVIKDLRSMTVLASLCFAFIIGMAILLSVTGL